MTDEDIASVEGLVNTEEALICDEMDFDVMTLRLDVEEIKTKFTQAQQEIFDVVMEAVKESQGLQIFI